MAYGTFGIAFGVMLWWKTQRRIDRTKSAIEVQVANAVTDIKGQVDEKLGSIKPPVIPEMPDVKAIVAEALSEYEMPPLNLEPLVEPLVARMNESLDMKLKSIKGNEANQVRRFLEEQGVSLEAAGKETEELLLQQLTDQQLALRRFATMKIPPAIKDNHPEWAALIQQVRPVAIEIMQRRLLGSGTVVQGGSSGAFNPGV